MDKKIRTALLSSLLFAVCSFGELLYSQPFNNGDKKMDQPFSEYGWTSIIQGASGLKKNLNHVGVGIGRSGGVPGPGQKKNAVQPKGFQQSVKGSGYGFYAPAKSEGLFSNNGPALFFVENLPFHLLINELQKLGCDQRNDNADSEIRFAVKIDSRWYVSDRNFGGENESWISAEMAPARFSDPSNWQLLGIKWGEGGYMVLGEQPTHALEGHIAACGVYVESGSVGGDGPGDHIRFDNFQVYGTAAKTVKPARPVKQEKPAERVNPVDPLGFITA